MNHRNRRQAERGPHARDGLVGGAVVDAADAQAGRADEVVLALEERRGALPLDDLLSVVREFLNPDVSRSGLDRCLRRHGAGNLRDARDAYTAFRGRLPSIEPLLRKRGLAAA